MNRFGQLKNDIAVLVQRSGDEDYINKIGVWVNFAHKTLFDVYDYYRELQTVFNFSSVDGTEDYMMPNDFDKPLRIFDLTNKKPIEITTEEVYFDSNISNIADANEGTPAFARIFGERGIQAVIAAAGTVIKVKSSSSSDTGSIVIRIEGYIDSAKTVLDFEDITISTGTPTTFVSGSKTFYDVIRVSKSANTVGFITIANSIETTLATMASIDNVLHYPILKLGLIPDGAANYRVLYKKKVRTLVNDNDYPFLDADEFLVLEAYGYALAQSKEGVDAANQIWSKSGIMLENLLGNVIGRLGPDYQHKMTTMLSQAHRQ